MLLDRCGLILAENGSRLWSGCPEHEQACGMASDFHDRRHLGPAAHILCNVSLCLEFALAGHGVAMLRKNMAAPEEKRGRLVRLLPEWNGPHHDLYTVTPAGQKPERVRIFADYLEDFFAGLV